MLKTVGQMIGGAAGKGIDDVAAMVGKAPAAAARQIQENPKTAATAAIAGVAGKAVHNANQVFAGVEHQRGEDGSYVMKVAIDPETGQPINPNAVAIFSKYGQPVSADETGAVFVMSEDEANRAMAHLGSGHGAESGTMPEGIA